ncbi:hypothetical protein AAG570_003509 [Ranatra chinensis]|uniref:Cilia- and flagella-associated protein 157 n=1 Tax=Ranatra chinensis TaxID=642074 RepID=A0ABD0Y3X1_9HEMI
MGKKGRGGKKKQLKEVKDALPEVDKEFYEIQINDLSKKITRLQNYCDQLEQQNEEMRNKLSKLDSDSADIISHLKRTLQNKKEEIIELNERITALEQAKQTEKNLFLEKINNMNLDFKRMHEHHTSEIKLLSTVEMVVFIQFISNLYGKLNSLEEFRTQREELMDKFEKQEADAAEQKEQHKNEVYELEKKEMETKLLNLSLDFQRATQARIASTTQSVIKENIAINNELNVLISAWKELNIENDNMREELKRLRIEYGIDKREKDRAMERNLIQAQVSCKMLTNLEVTV